MLETLKNKCYAYNESLEIINSDVNEYINNADENAFDIIVTNSFLHHIPDYISLLQGCIKLLRPEGQIFSFQDPLYYDKMKRFDYYFSKGSYFFWRLFKGNYLQGIKTRIRRISKNYSENNIEDFTEYHVVRDGVDENSIKNLLEKNDFTFILIKYFSTQNILMQKLGELLNIKNTFGFIAKRK